MLGVDLDGTGRVLPAHVGCLVDPDGSRRTQKDRLDDQTDDQVPTDRKPDGKASRRVQRWMINAMAAVQTWRHRGGWRYNIVSAAKPVTDRDNGQQRGPRCGTSGGAGAAPAQRTRLRGGRGGDVGCDQVPAQRAVLRRAGDRAPGPGPDPGGRAARTLCRQPAGVGLRGLPPTGSSSPSLPGYGVPPGTSPARRRRSRWWPQPPTTPACATWSSSTWARRR